MRKHDNHKLNRFSVLTRLWNDRTSWLMMSPFLVFYILMTLIPAVASIVLSFTYFNMFSAPRFIGLDNYIRMFMEDDVFITALSNTLVAAFVIGPGGYVLSFLMAWLINDISPRIRWLITLIFYAPSISGAAYVVWTFILSPDAYGLMNSILLKFGLISTPMLFFQDSDMALMLVILVQLWMSMGVGFLGFIAGLQNADRSLYECGAIDGIRSRWQELWYITLPQMKPMMVFGAVTQIAAAYSVGQVSQALCGFPSVDYSAHTILLHALDYGSTRYQMGYAGAVCVVLFVLVLITYKLANFAISRVGQ